MRGGRPSSFPSRQRRSPRIRLETLISPPPCSRYPRPPKRTSSQPLPSPLTSSHLRHLAKTQSSRRKRHRTKICRNRPLDQSDFQKSARNNHAKLSEEVYVLFKSACESGVALGARDPPRLDIAQERLAPAVGTVRLQRQLGRPLLHAPQPDTDLADPLSQHLHGSPSSSTWPPISCGSSPGTST